MRAAAWLAEQGGAAGRQTDLEVDAAHARSRADEAAAHDLRVQPDGLEDLPEMRALPLPLPMPLPPIQKCAEDAEAPP